MPFKETKTLTNENSKVRIDVETLARLEFSDIDFLLNKIKGQEVDNRMERILHETIISKLASIFQLAMKAYDYIEEPELRKSLIKTFDSSTTSTGKIGKYRAELFHQGIHFFEKTVFYPFGKFTGRGFNGIHIKRGAKLTILGVWEFNSNKFDYAITSEGVFEISNYGKKNENWNLINDFPTVTAINYNQTKVVIQKSIKELSQVWFKIHKTMNSNFILPKKSFLNENGSWELIEVKDDKHTVYKAENKKLEINGELTITPPKKIRIKNNKLIFE